LENTKIGQLHWRFADQLINQIHGGFTKMHLELKEERATLQDQHESVLKNIMKSKQALRKVFVFWTQFGISSG
jgi:hypothetical protein